MKGSMQISIQPLHPKEIECFYKCDTLKINKDVSLVIGGLTVSGNYPLGSKGAHVGEYLRGLSVFLREYGNLDGMIIDLSGMSYKLGNNLSGIVSPNVFATSEEFKESWLGYKIVGSQKNRGALESLLDVFDLIDAGKKIYTSSKEAMKDFNKEGKIIYHE